MSSLTLAKIRKIQRSALDWVVTNNPGLGLDKRAELFVKLFEKHLDQGSRILDVGGGWGFYGEPLKIRGHHPVVVDVCRPGFQKSPVVLYDGQSRLPFSDKSFDVSLLITVLHHVEDPAQVVR